MMHWALRRLPTSSPCEIALPIRIPARRTAAQNVRVSARGEHVRMLEYAAARRRRAAEGGERAYWMACAPAALARAARVRHEADFACLP